MLDRLDDIPWSTLEHAYGDAGDIPNLLRALVSSDPDQRAWAQDMLDMGPFHQGSIYSCTPFVVRVLLQILQEKGAVDVPWILRYVSRVLDAAIFTLSLSEPRTQDPEQAYAAQILVEIRAQWPVLLSMLEHPDVHVRLALLRLLVLLRADLPHLETVLAEKLDVETDEPMRAALVFCFSLVVDDAPLPQIQRMLETATESPLVRIAAGFGLIAAMKEHIADEALAAFCEVIVDQFAALDRFEDMYAEYLTPLGAPLGKDRLLECLQQRWSVNQRSQIILALLSIYAQLPKARSGGRRVGSGYYLEAMVRVAYPDGKLAPETTIRDLNDLQRRILEAFQQYDMPSIKWNVYALDSDCRLLLGFDFRSETDFLDFMSGERSAQRTKG
jgi:hypothetical protein